jgi:hypothetical protein
MEKIMKGRTDSQLHMCRNAVERGIQRSIEANDVEYIAKGNKLLRIIEKEINSRRENK